jgi:hypothetical protein
MAATLVKKLRLQPGQKAAIVNAPPDYVERLGDLPQGVEIATEPGARADFIHLFVANQADLERLGPAVLEAVEYDGLLWISYPKRSSKVETDLTRDRGWELLTEAGMRPVTQVSIDDVWSALRWRPSDRVGR